MLNAADFGTTKINGSWSCEPRPPSAQRSCCHLATTSTNCTHTWAHMGTLCPYIKQSRTFWLKRLRWFCSYCADKVWLQVWIRCDSWKFPLQGSHRATTKLAAQTSCFTRTKKESALVLSEKNSCWQSTCWAATPEPLWVSICFYAF